ncbi:MAG: RHS repeat domain-containing protein [Nitrospiraceae bacterium]
MENGRGNPAVFLVRVPRRGVRLGKDTIQDTHTYEAIPGDPRKAIPGHPYFRNIPTPIQRVGWGERSDPQLFGARDGDAGVRCAHRQPTLSHSPPACGPKCRYQLGDHLGSIDTLVDENGVVVERMSFDAHGNRRDADTWSDAALAPGVPANTTRGFTGHEHIDAANIVHMNGRLYDPALGRMLSADPIVQELFNAQNLNRYTYVLNNPLSFTDPTGLSFFSKYWRTIIAVALTTFVPELAVLLHSQLLAVAVVGFVSGVVTSGTLKGGLFGAFSAVLFHGIGLGFNTYETSVLAHGVGGGIMAELQGGKFGSGFASAGVFQVLSPLMGPVASDGGSNDFNPRRVIAAAIVGGTASAASGGKFANGAVTGAFSYAFSSLARRGDQVDAETAPKRMTKREFDRRVRSLRKGTALDDAKDIARSRIDTFCTSGADCSEVNVASFNKVTFRFSRLDFDPSSVQGSLGLSLATNDLNTVGIVDIFPGALVLADKASPSALAGRLIHEFIHETPTNISLSRAYWNSGQSLDWQLRPQEIHAIQLEQKIK